ncbi:hypothetical protein ELX58_01840 [Acetilactobacillus jinshanensis]|uniref:DAGKc domain-containing protein n=1 Tax=Acetilactobacillus jinshanensis TaxID=1720083 RepID=A0A4P6ZK40_9LACO|nr:hypothetical protein ELX58_01840 [Acetilactobacillus jinshanensis]
MDPLFCSRENHKLKSKYLIIVNNFANGGATKKIWPKIQATLDHRHVNYTATISKYHRNAILIIEEYVKLANSDDVLLVVGGDGTLNEVVNASEKMIRIHPDLSKLPIAYIPTGHRHDFALRHHISLDWQKALDNVLGQGHHVHQVMIGYFDEIIKNQRVYFLNNVGLGLNADLINTLHHSKIGWKALRYFMAFFSLLYNLQSFTMEIYHPHKTTIYPNVFLADISLSNNPKDHHFNLTIIERHNLLIMFYIFFRVLFKHKIKLKSVHYVKVNDLHIGIPTLEYGHADGEELGDRFYDSYYHTTKYPFIY